jgi:hypothetical protein
LPNKSPIGSSGLAKTDPRLLDALKLDVETLGRQLNTASTIFLSGPRVVMPKSGSVVVRAVSNTATAGSTGLAYHVFKVLRSGQDEGRSYDTRNFELAAYSLAYFGTLKVGTGDVLTVSVAVTGAPSPTLTSDNFTLSCELTPATER